MKSRVSQLARLALVALVPLGVGVVAGSAVAAPVRPGLRQGSLRLAAVTRGPPAAGPAAPAAPAPVAAPAPYARPYRLAISFAFGFGSVDMERFHAYIDDVSLSSGAKLPESLKSNLQINAEFAFRYYFPWFILAQVGYSTVYNKASAELGPVSTVHVDNLIMEVPILFGGYYTLIGRLYVFAAIGPSVYFYPRSWWDADPGSAPDYKSDMGVGFTFMTGADFMVTDNFAVGLELRYRNLRAEPLNERSSGVTIPGDYDLDFSGVSLAGVLRAYAF